MGTINLDDPTRYLGGTIQANRPGVHDRRLAATRRLADLLDDLEREVERREPPSLTAYELLRLRIGLEAARGELAGRFLPTPSPAALVDAAADESWQETQ